MGSVVIINGVTFIAFLTATITSHFVSAEGERVRAGEQQQRAAELARANEALRRIERQLAEIQARLDE